MSENNRESFIRWQSVSRDHFSTVANLILGLSTGLLAFQADLLIGDNSLKVKAPCLIALSSIFLCVSLLCAVICSINRLKDFRETAQIARNRMKGESEGQEEKRLENKITGKNTWKLLKAQLVLFAIGIIFFAIAIIIQASQSQ